MLSHNYTYQECLDNSKKVSWREDDVLAGKNFDFSKRFLPNKLTGVDEIGCLNDDEKRQLNSDYGQRLLPHLRVRRGVYRSHDHGRGYEGRLWG